MDAVIAAVVSMEDGDLFNAGRGAVFATNGEVQTDASVMASSGACGAIGGVRGVKNPILLAREVMDNTPHVTLWGVGAERLAKERGLVLARPEYFYVQERWDQLMRARKQDIQTLDHGDDDNSYGTVGAVALDEGGRLAAATSTGGMVNKMDGRIGDTGVIGAGTWADPRVALSGTGHGEVFIARAVCARVAHRMEFGGMTLEQATSAVIHGDIAGLGAGGGVIACDHAGNISMPFNTAGMFRGSVRDANPPSVAIWP